MSFLPELQLGWLNGWLLLVLLYGTFGILMRIWPREVVSRLYGRSGWTRRDYVLRAITVPIMLAYFGLMIFLPLKLGMAVFWIGLAIYLLGAFFFFNALVTYRETPLDQPVRGGIYRYSRNPQLVGLWLAFVGTSVATGCWLALILVVLAMISGRTRVLVEERACLAAYGDAYAQYMQEVPRYFGRPKRSREAFY
jgi:protein-S-isoprenylcysteine O-methyltransferase Ste14